jgi:uncharacterized membrane protein YfcA
MGPMPPLAHDPWFLVAACIATILLGLGKGGFAGIGAISTPLVALVIGPVQAAAIMLPILIVQDVVGVWAFRHSWNRSILALMIPFATLGVFVAWFFAASLPESAMQALLGLISVVFAARSLWLQRGGAVPAPRNPPRWLGALMGVASGVTSQVAHAGQPPFQIYVLPQRLSRDMLLGTTAIFFASLNWIKVPFYIALGQFTRVQLLTSAMLLPLAIASTFAGVWLARRIDADRFYTLVFIMMGVVGMRLVYVGLA